MTIPPAEFDFNIYQGVTWEEIIAFLDEDKVRIDIENWFISFVAKKYGEDAAMIELTTINGGIVINAADKEFTMTLSSEETADLEMCQIFYQLDATDTNGVSSRRLIGKVNLIKSL